MDTGPGTNSCTCNSGYSGSGTTCTASFGEIGTFPPNGMDLSSDGGFVLLLEFNGPAVFSGTGSATIYDLTAGTQTDCPLSGMGNGWGPDNAEIYIAGLPNNSPAHTYAVEVSSDLIVGFPGISDTVTWTWLR